MSLKKFISRPESGGFLANRIMKPCNFLNLQINLPFYIIIKGFTIQRNQKVTKLNDVRHQLHVLTGKQINIVNESLQFCTAFMVCSFLHRFYCAHFFAIATIK